MLDRIIVLSCFFLLSACGSLGQETNPATPQACVKVWVFTEPGANHSDLIVRLSDFPVDFWDDISVTLPGWATHVAFGFYDIEYMDGQRSQLMSLLPSPGGLRVTALRHSPESWPVTWAVVPIAVDKQFVAKVLDYVKGDMSRAPDNFIYPLDSTAGVPQSQFVLNSPRDYDAFNFCHSWVIGALRAGGLTDLPVRTYRSQDLLRQLNVRFPREDQFCPGYINRVMEGRQHRAFESIQSPSS